MKPANSFYIARLFILLLPALILASCGGGRGRNLINSRDLPESERVSVLSQYLKLKSTVIFADYVLFNVNLDDRSVPGASGADYKIRLQVFPDDTARWTAGRAKDPAPAPLDSDWLEEIIGPDEIGLLTILPFDSYTEETAGSSDTLWAHPAGGVILIRYIVR